MYIIQRMISNGTYIIVPHLRMGIPNEVGKNAKRFECIECNLVSSNNADLQRHIKAGHNKKRNI